MPRVDAYLGDRVPTAKGPQQRYQPQRADQGLAVAQGLDRVAQVTSQIYEDQKQRANDTFAVSTQTALNTLYQGHALSKDRGPGGAKGLLTMQGREAQDRYDDNLQEVDAQLDMLKTTAKTGDQQLIFAKMAQAWRANYVDQAMRHTTAELVKYEASENQALAQSSVSTGAAAHGTPNAEKAIAEQLRIQETLIDERGESLGYLGEEGKKRGKAVLRSKTLAAGVHKLIDMGDDIAATEAFDRYMAKSEAFPQGQILEEDADALRGKLQTNSTDGWAFRMSAAIVKELGPKTGQEPFRINDMTARAREASGGDPKKFTRLLEYLRSEKVTWDAQQKDEEDTRVDRLSKAVELGVPAARLQAMPEFKNANEGTQAAALRAARERVERTQAQARSNAQYGEWLAEAPYRKLEREERHKGITGSSLYYDLIMHPAQFVDMPEERLAGYAATLNRGMMADVRQRWEQVHGNLAAASTANVDNTVFNNMVVEILPFALDPSLDGTQKTQVAQVRHAVNLEIQAEEQRQTRATGRKTSLDAAGQQKVMRDVIDRVAMRPGFFGEYTAPAVTVTQDEVGFARVPFDQIPEAGKRAMRDYLRSLPQVAGTTPSHEISDTEINSRYKTAMERAWVQSGRGAGEAAWQRLLQESTGTLAAPPRRPPAPRQAPASVRPAPSH